MTQQPVSPICDCCGLPIKPGSGEDCPRCNYPINRIKEEHFLESSLRDLQRVAINGGADVTVSGLIGRYRTRLNYLRSLHAAMPLFAAGGKQSEKVPAPKPPPVPVWSAVVVTPEEKPQQPARRGFSFSWRSFVVDQAITIIGLLGAFLILMGALNSVVTMGGNPLLSFLIVFGVHAFFGIAGVVAYRFTNFKLIARLYSGIYVLLVPLVGFTSYNLMLGTHITLSLPTLIAIAAAYAAIVYTLLAIYQGFSIYGYLGAMALIVADLAVAADLHLNYCWWPAMLMPLAFAALTSIARSPSTRRERYFTGMLLVLRQPVRVFMYSIAGICLLSAVGVTVLSLSLGSTFFNASMEEIRFSILSMSVLLLIWTAAWFWLTKRTRELPVLALLFLACVLAFCYVFNFSQGGYTLVLVSVALLYHTLNRFVVPLLQPLGNLGRLLDQIALVLVCLAPFISSPLLPQQLFSAANQIPLESNPNLYVHLNGAAAAELIAVGVGCLLTVSIILFHANHRIKTENQYNNWPWLFLLSGFLLNWELSTIVLSLNLVPAWFFVGLTLALIGIAVHVRQRFGSYWANPIDVLVLVEALLALGLCLNQGADHLSMLLLGFAVLFYAVALYQRRQRMLFLPLVFAVLALPILLFSRPYVALLIGALLPFAAVAIRRIMANRTLAVSEESATKSGRATLWEWPLVAIGLLYGAAAGLMDVLVSQYSALPQSIVGNWLGVIFPVALELAVLSLAWYASAALTRIKWWLIPVISFASVALLLPGNQFWVLVTVTPVAAILGFGVSRSFDRTWASPLYIVALLSAIMTGIVGYLNPAHLLATSWILVVFGLLFYTIGLLEGLEPCLWLLPAFTAWALLDAAQLGDLYRPLVIALLYAGVGVAIGLRHSVILPILGSAKKNNFLKYALPFYATAFAAALLTGMDSASTAVNPLFYLVVMMLYALIAYAVALFERQPYWLFIVAGFAIWGTLLAPRASIEWVIGIAIATALIGLLFGRVTKRPLSLTGGLLSRYRLTSFKWGWPWYLISLIAMIWTVVWQQIFGLESQAGIIAFSLLVFTAIAVCIMLVERVPEVLVLPAIFAALAIWLWQPHLDITTMMIAFSILCVLIFVSQLIWKVITPLTKIMPASLLHNVAGMGGQFLVILVIIGNGGLFASSGPLAFVGAGSLFVLALMAFCYGRIQENNIVQRCCDYSAGSLVSLVVCWTLAAFGQANLDLLTLAPATYLTVIAPLLLRDETLPEHRMIGEGIAVLGAALLLLPTLWLSFTHSEENLLYTLVLIGEALALLLLGIGAGVRIFVLTGAGLIVVAALHALFLPNLAIPTPLALTILGVTLLGVATGLSLVRRRLRTAWSQWD